MILLTKQPAQSYNVKVVQFENGTVEVRRYSDGYFPTDVVEKAKDGSFIYNPKHSSLEKVYNPFTESFEDVRWIDDLEADQARSDQVSFNRTKNAVYSYSRQCSWNYFITLTFDSSKADRYDYKDCTKKARNWFSNQKKRYAPDLKYLCVPERHKDGAWHMHALIADTGDMIFEDSGRVSYKGKAFKRTAQLSKFPTIFNLSGWRYGWSTATEVRDTHRVSSYLVKYITKDLCSYLKSANRYFRSNNISPPSESSFVVSPDDFKEWLNILSDSLGMEVTYCKSVSGFQDVDYIYLQ